MKSHNDILEWYRATGLRPYLEVLPDDKKNEFECDIMENLYKDILSKKTAMLFLGFRGSFSQRARRIDDH